MREPHIEEFETSGSRSTMPCGECGATRAQRANVVFERPVAYNCSRCVAGLQPGNRATKRGREAPRKDRSGSLCLLGGKHPSGSPWAAECPRDPARVARRSERARRANEVRWARKGSR
jgi:hypothetical protein